VTADVAARTGAGVEPGSVLEQLCSAGAAVFAEQIWGRRAWLSSRDDLVGDVTEVFSLQAVDELLSRRALRTPFIRLAKNGRIVPPSRYTGSGGAGAQVGDQVHDDAVLRLFADGTTVALQGVHRTWQPVGRLAADLATYLGHPVQVNAYVTPPQAQGFASHYDTHDVFVLQVAGRKQWRVHEPVLASPLTDEPWETVRDQIAARAEQPPVVDAVLQPGDCLYLPRGFLHSAVALGETSVHLTFGVHAAREGDVVRAVTTAVQRRWRRSLPVGWDPASAEGRSLVARIAAEVAEAITDLDLGEVATALHDERGALQRPEPLSPLAQADLAASLQPHTTVRLRAHLAARLDEAESIVVLPGRVVPLPPGEAHGVRRLLSGEPTAAADLGNDEHALALVRLLLREGVVVPADPER
jgi:quercetin dioxygenase-like cupin family protein